MPKPVLQVASFSKRANLAWMLNKRGLLLNAVEVGTHRGVFASEFLRIWKGQRFYCVDPWIAGYDDTDPASLGNREEDFNAAQQLLSEHLARVRYLRKYSVEAAKEFPDKSLQFVYVDGCHQPESIKTDLETWWPKLGNGGILAGHDIVCPRGSDEWGWAIQPVVWNFAIEHERTIYLVEERRPYPWSYYLVR